MGRDRRLLGFGVLGAVNTLNAYRPIIRRGNLAALSFTAAWPTSEAPLLTVGAQAVGLAALVRRGGPRSPAGKAGMVLTIGSWAGLVGLARAAGRSPAVLDDALRAALGAGYRRELAEDADPPLTWAQRVLPAVGEHRYRVATDVSYGPFRRNRLDIWRDPKLPGDARAPVLVHVHGGGWVIGDKTIQGELLLSEMARRGWVGVSMTYRLSPKATWPDHIVDVKRGLAWVRQHIAEQGGDPGFIAITGGSAGGHLVALAALTSNDPALQPGFESADTSVDAAVPFYGVYDVGDLAGSGRREILRVWERFVMKARVGDNRQAWESASPVARVCADAPPMFVLHGDNDSLVPVEQARRFVATLRQTSTSPVAYAELPGAQHAFEVFRSVRGTHAIRAVARFLEVVYRRRAAER